MESLLAFLRRLDEGRIHYALGSYRDSITVHVTASGTERWEVDFFSDGRVEVERFVSTGEIADLDQPLLDALLGG